MLRVLPWITDGATEFIDNFIAERKTAKGTVKVFEFGCGNSTLYFLSRGCIVRSIEHDEAWSSKVQQTAKTFDYHDRLNLSCEQRPYHQSYKNDSYDIVLIDGRDRMLCMSHILQVGLPEDAILVFDNSERAEYKYTDFINEMDIQGRDAIHFEQPQVERGNLRLTSKSYARDRVEHRWITSVFAPRGLYTTQGKTFIRPKAVKPVSESHYKALNDLDKKLEKYVFHRDGFFIEAGANDGVKQSNSHYFAKALGWKGILVEAIPALYNACVTNRPESAVYNCALVPSADISAITMHFADLMSTVDGALKEQQDEHIARGLKVQNITQTYSIEVPAKTLTEVIKSYKASTAVADLKIDFLSLDVEGYELEVLKGLDLQLHRPAYMLIESRSIDEIENYLSANDYQQIERFSHHDYLFADSRIVSTSSEM
ncbi:MULTISPECIES: FkbM family methyltransferase [Rheinheimera]|uniref:Methyltransferase FkbM domain-containing protein n=1 Tax=Rheinheimera aquimaris TaxID=412437 RepID=A0ABN1D9D7_9GAMM|nr:MULTISPECIES: FkbM family methyltransferase [Rheinheimera]MCB5212656.1 FkbM family methyltransferase [Rheinheimera aquimaris]